MEQMHDVGSLHTLQSGHPGRFAAASALPRCHHRFNKAPTLCALRAKTAFPLLHPRTHRPLGGMVRRVQPCKRRLGIHEAILRQRYPTWQVSFNYVNGYAERLPQHKGGRVCRVSLAKNRLNAIFSGTFLYVSRNTARMVYKSYEDPFVWTLGLL
jgi:hypothetical protein